MNFIFQYGDFFNETSHWDTLMSFIGSILGALISGLIALWVYRKGEKKQAQIEKQRLDDIDNYFRSSLKILMPSIGYFQEQIKTKIDELSIPRFGIEGFNFHIGLKSIQDLKRLDHTDIFKIYISELELGSDALRSCMDSLAFIEENMSLLGKLESDYSIDIKEFVDRFEEKYELLDYQLLNFTDSSKENNNDLVNKIIEIVNNDEITNREYLDSYQFMAETLIVDKLIDLDKNTIHSMDRNIINTCHSIKIICAKIKGSRNRLLTYFKFLDYQLNSAKSDLSNFLAQAEKKRRLTN